MKTKISALLLVAFLSACTTSAQARNAQQAGGVLLATGLITSTAGGMVLYGANQSVADTCGGGPLSRACASYEQQARNGGTAIAAGSALAGIGFWTLIISSIQRPILENQEELMRRRAELQIIETSF